MAQGTERRQGVTDSLAGAAEVVPIARQAPSLQISNETVPDVVNSKAGQLARSLTKWSSSKFQAAANTQHEASILDGQMAYQQGKAMEDVEMDGDKWSLSGYRVMQAQTLSATMLSSQREMIRQSQYEQDPDAFRATYVNRMEQQIKDLDPQTAKMVRESMAEQMPTLVAEHTAAYVGHQEDENYKTLAASVDALSQDSSSFQALIDNAMGGEGSASAGLSADRRMSALIDGVGAAFENMNPIAYQQLKQSGALESMSGPQRQALRGQKEAFENRVRGTYDADHQEQMTNFTRNLDAGEYTPAEATEKLAAIWGKRHVSMSAAEGGAAYSSSVQAQDYGDRALTSRIGTAIARGDTSTLAKLTQDIVMQKESGGDPNAVSPVGAEGLMQVMPATQDDPGFGIRPSNGTPADTVRVGQEYWAKMLGGSEANSILKWGANDIEAAAIAYNAGPGNANKWIAAGRDYSVLPKRSETEPYAKSILASSNGEADYYTAAETESIAKAELKTAQRLRAELMKDAADAQVVAATIEYDEAMLKNDRLLEVGAITGDEYRAAANIRIESLGLTKTVAQGNRINSTITQAAEAARTAAQQLADDAAKAAREQAIELAQVKQAELHNGLQLALAVPGITPEQSERAVNEFTEAVATVYGEAGLTLKESNLSQTVSAARASQRTADQKTRDFAVDGNVIARAVATGTVDQLPQALQDRYWREAGAEVSKTIADGESAGTIPAGAANALVTGGIEEASIKAGTVPTNVAAMATNSMRNPIGDDGKPTPEAIETMAQYQRLVDGGSQDAANSLFSTDKARNTAAEIMEAAQGNLSNPQLIGDAIVAAYNDREMTLGLNSVQTPANQDRIAKEVTDAVDSWARGEDIGVLQGMFSGDTDVSQAWLQTNVEQDLAGAQAGREQLSGAVTVEVNRLLKADPAMSTKIAIQQATARVLDRTAVVGGSMHIMDPGFNMIDQMLGGSANDLARPGIEGEIITSYLADMIESGELSEEFGNVSVWESVPGAGAVLGAADFVAGIFGGEVEQRAMKPMDAIAVANRGVRPYILETDGTTGGAVRILLPDGTYSERIAIPYATAGAQYKLKYQESLSE